MRGYLLCKFLTMAKFEELFLEFPKLKKLEIEKEGEDELCITAYHGGGMFIANSIKEVRQLIKEDEKLWKI